MLITFQNFLFQMLHIKIPGTSYSGGMRSDAQTGADPAWEFWGVHFGTNGFNTFYSHILQTIAHLRQRPLSSQNLIHLKGTTRMTKAIIVRKIINHVFKEMGIRVLKC